VLQAQTNRIDRMKRRFEQVEKDYLRKMTEMEKNLYRSPLL
jgi:DNA-binding ferritin-like protein (Dps family)